VKRQIQIIVLGIAVTGLASGCLATRKFTRNEVKSASDAISAKYDPKLETMNGEIKENKDAIDATNQRVASVDQRVTGVDQRVSGVDTKVTDLDNRTTQSVNTLKTDLNGVSTKTDSAVKDLATLDVRFQNRNNLTVSMQKSIEFKFDSASLPADQNAALDEVAELVRKNPDAIVVLEGRADSTGDKEYNVRLGERRVDAVRRYLAVEKEVPVYRIEQISFGSERPVAPNDSRDGRQKNRSVLLVVLVPSMEGRTAAR
jgi:outer membrane protein OmpA-like peptidoglycan-associated protein